MFGGVAVAVGLAVVAQTWGRVWAAEHAQRAGRQLGTGRQADAIVVFGGHCFESGPSLEVRDRLDHAMHLWRGGVAPVIAVSGGHSGDVDETESMGTYLITHGVPQEAVTHARPGANTRETITSLARGHRYVAVSSAYHAHLIDAEARRQGKAVRVDCPADSYEMREGRLLRIRRATEVAACIVYAAPPSVAGPARRSIGRARYLLPTHLGG